MSEGNGLPPKDGKKGAGIGLPGGRRVVRMPESSGLPPRAGLPGKGFPTRSEKASAGNGSTNGSSGNTPAVTEGLPKTGLPGASQEKAVPVERVAPPMAKTAPPVDTPSSYVAPPTVEAPPISKGRDEVALPVPSTGSGLPSTGKRVVKGVDPSRANNHGGFRESLRGVQEKEKSPLAGSELWEDESVPDTSLGLNAEAPVVKKASKRKAKFSLTRRDIEIIRLCARYRFAYREQIQHYFESENVRNRLTRLADEGLLRKDMVTQNQALWLPSQAGLDVADLDLTHIERGRYSATSIAHSIGLLNLGIEFEKGWENLLKEDVWPNFNRVGEDGERLQGEHVITEREITNSFNRLKGIAKGDGRKSGDVSHELIALRNDALAELPEPGRTPMEMREGMAGLFVNYFQNKSHTPDMVVARPRNEDGSSNHIAIELELNPKPIVEWIRILRAFKADPMFKSVVYFTHKRSINNQLTEVNRKHVGLSPEQFRIFKYTPRNDSIPFWG